MKRTKLVLGILFGLYVILAAGALAWLVYGAYSGDYSRVSAVIYSAGIALTFIILLYKVRRS